MHAKDNRAKVWGDQEGAKDASPSNHVRKGLPPFLMLAGDTTDMEKSLARQGEEFVRNLTASKVPAEFVTIKDRDHSTIVTKLGTAGDEAAERIMKFIRANKEPN